MAQTDVRELPRIDQVFLGLGVLILIASFLPYYGASYLGVSDSATAWHGWAALALILMLVATALVAVQLMTDATLPTLKVSWNVVVVAVDALGALILLIRTFTLDSGHTAGFSYGVRWGGWLLILAAIAQVVVAGLRFRASGEPMPWAAPGEAPTSD
jgi:amino acid transporter